MSDERKDIRDFVMPLMKEGFSIKGPSVPEDFGELYIVSRGEKADNFAQKLQKELSERLGDGR